MQLLGWPFHSGWMLLTVISVCCCIDIGSSTEVSEEAVEERSLAWNDLNYADALRKYHSIVDVGGGDIDDDSIAGNRVSMYNNDAGPSPNGQDEMAALQQNEPRVLKSRTLNSQSNSLPRDTIMSDGSDREDDYIYDVEGRPVVAISPDVERYQFYYKPVDIKRSASPKRLAGDQLSSLRRIRGQHQLEFKDASTAPSSIELAVMARQTADSSSAEPEPRALPLLGSHAALSKLSRQKEAILKKILRQAARRQSMKRSPNCMRKCIAQGLLHPAQCHSLC